jgi:hypothetical protein
MSPLCKDEASLTRRRRRRERCAGLVVRGNSSANGRRRERCAGLVVRGNSRANVAKSMWREHGLAVAAYHSHLTFEANSVLHTGDRTEPEAGVGEEVLNFDGHLFYQHRNAQSASRHKDIVSRDGYFLRLGTLMKTNVCVLMVFKTHVILRCHINGRGAGSKGECSHHPIVGPRTFIIQRSTSHEAVPLTGEEQGLELQNGAITLVGNCTSSVQRNRMILFL